VEVLRKRDSAEKSEERRNKGELETNEGAYECLFNLALILSLMLSCFSLQARVEYTTKKYIHQYT